MKYAHNQLSSPTIHPPLVNCSNVGGIARQSVTASPVEPRTRTKTHALYVTFPCFSPAGGVAKADDRTVVSLARTFGGSGRDRDRVECAPSPCVRVCLCVVLGMCGVGALVLYIVYYLHTTHINVQATIYRRLRAQSKRFFCECVCVQRKPLYFPNAPTI